MTEKLPVKFSVLDLAFVIEGGTAADAFRRSLDLAQHAEGWGYTRFWLAEHHNMAGIASAATSVLIGHVAGGTSRIRVGSGGIMLPNHSPLIIAEHFGTLAELFPGRIDLGIGRAPGGDGLTARALRRGLGNSEEEFPRSVEELIAYLDPATTGRGVRAIPGEGSRVPVWLLGSSTYSAQLAGRLGLPFAFASHFAPQEMFEALFLYRRNFQPSAALDKPYTMVGIPLVAAETDEQAHYLATTLYQRFLKLIRGRDLFSQPPIESMDGLWTPQERAVIGMKLGAAIIGGAETVAKKLANLVRETQVDEVIFTSELYDHADRLRSFEIASGIIRAAQPRVAEALRSA